ncbi:uncharacterized protein CC84DRAFT_1180328 [Paraphaeosphaeria sporulosa]|uniref:Uncharacterized protein n=1 Tax=Paraphaeosphaeria sporulosa TaxID=1460663 RepID=A0A177BY51_9PLEO|nr:uncharacterized protein CC84DRAFT_1180328 [Paraphaeosphaeria sporulosa]OAG00283.1 hypothetical protein CC84DRAFT_1180328 [Paraphaeosphaeria sporulosa]
MLLLLCCWAALAAGLLRSRECGRETRPRRPLPSRAAVVSGRRQLDSSLSTHRAGGVSATAHLQQPRPLHLPLLAASALRSVHDGVPAMSGPHVGPWPLRRQ